jgi:tRNA modification GTPase
MATRSPAVIQLTPPGRGAIATLLVEGPKALAVVQSSFRSASDRPLDAVAADRLAFGHVGPEPGEEIIVRVRSAESVELHCHGGQAAVALVHRVLVEQGCRPVSWQEWARQGSEAPRGAAALLALAEARTERTAAILLDQHHGALSRAVDAVRERLEQDDSDGARKGLEETLAQAPTGLHLVQPWRVVVAGPPNAGKSTLVNAMVGYARAIVDPQAGTTRDLVSAITAIDGWPVELCDTAGLRDAAHPVEQAGVDVARRSLADADLVLLVFDLCQPWSAAEQELVSAQPEAIVVHNKADLAPGAVTSRPPGHRVSALDKEGIEDLLRAIAVRLVPHPPERGAAVPFTADQVSTLFRASHALGQGDPDGARHVLVSLATHR